MGRGEKRINRSSSREFNKRGNWGYTHILTTKYVYVYLKSGVSKRGCAGTANSNSRAQKYFIIMQQSCPVYLPLSFPRHIALCIQKNILISCIFCAHFTILHGFLAAFVVAVRPRARGRPGLSRLLCKNSDNKLAQSKKKKNMSWPPLYALPTHAPLRHKNFSSFSTSNLK